MQKQITLNPGQSQRISFVVAPSAVGAYYVTLDGLTGSFESIQDPGVWTPGIVVDSITVTPTTLYLGNSITIDVYITYPSPKPDTIHAVVSVNGGVLSGDFQTTYARVTFVYTPAHTGNFTATAQDKSAAFSVLESPAGTYYSPFGGTRMPLCTQIVVPSSGGDITRNGLSSFGFSTRIDPTSLAQAQATVWTPKTATVRSYARYVDLGYWDFVIIMATDFTCQPYWGSKEELARMIVGYTGNVGIGLPTEWILQYGTTCPTCNGTGRVWSDRRHRYVTCPTCNGRGKILLVNLSKGIRDWVKSPSIRANGFQGEVQYTITCPYNDSHVFQSGWIDAGWNTNEKVAFATQLLSHIESAHPTHPLTSPAWF